jgi:hypothetical protein
MKTMDQIMNAYTSNTLQGIRFTELYPRSVNVNGGTVEWGSNGKPIFTNVSFAFREAVDITTYDENLAAQLRALSEISTEPSVTPEPVAVNGKVVNKTPVDLAAEKIVGGAKGVVRSAVNKLFNIPSTNAPIADNGAVRFYTPPPAGNNVGG